jgi:hypothetical protein
MCTLIWDYFGGSLLPCSFISWQLHSIWLHKLIQQTPLCPTQPCSPSHQRFPHWSAYGTATTCTLHSISIPQLIKCLQPNALPYFWPAQKGSRTRYAQHLHWKDHREVAATALHQTSKATPKSSHKKHNLRERRGFKAVFADVSNSRPLKPTCISV